MSVNKFTERLWFSSRVEQEHSLLLRLLWGPVFLIQEFRSLRGLWKRRLVVLKACPRYYRVFGVVTIRGGMEWMIGFIDTSCTQLVTTICFSAIAIYTLYSSLLHTLVFSDFISRILETDS
jgi:hypothetical protein